VLGANGEVSLADDFAAPARPAVPGYELGGRWVVAGGAWSLARRRTWSSSSMRRLFAMPVSRLAAGHARRTRLRPLTCKEPTN